jgi:hypothetical protein
MYKNDFSASRENEIGMAWEFLDMQAIPKAHSVDKTTYCHLRFCVL